MADGENGRGDEDGSRRRQGNVDVRFYPPGSSGENYDDETHQRRAGHRETMIWFHEGEGVKHDLNFED